MKNTLLFGVNTEIGGRFFYYFSFPNALEVFGVPFVAQKILDDISLSSSEESTTSSK